MRHKLKLPYFLIAAFLPGCQLLLFLPTAPPRKAKAFIEAEILEKAYESLVPLYVIGHPDKPRSPSNAWYAIPAREAGVLEEAAIDKWEGVLDIESVSRLEFGVYEKIPAGIELKVVEIDWVENPAVAQFQIVVEFPEGALYKRIPLEHCFEFGDSGVEVEDIVNNAHELNRHEGSFRVRANPLYIKEVEP